MTPRGRAPARLSPGLQASLMAGYGAFVLFGLLHPAPSPETVDTSLTGVMEWRFQRSLRSATPVLPSRLLCGDRFEPIFQNGLGWTSSCGVDTFTTVALGVPAKPGDRYRLRARTEGMAAAPSLRVYVNGAIYVARKADDSYEADVTIPYARLDAPVVIVTVEWTGALDPPPGKLLWIEIA